jgi:cytochrome c-type biogenesis protein CcmH/NrfG
MSHRPNHGPSQRRNQGLLSLRFAALLACCMLFAAHDAAAQQGGAGVVQAAPSQALLAQGRPDDAMRGLEARVGTNPFDAVSMNNLAAVKASRQDWYGAAELLVRAHRIAPDNSIIEGNLDQLNQYLSQRAAPGRSTAPAHEPAEGAVWPEPPALWPLTAASAVGIQQK